MSKQEVLVIEDEAQWQRELKLIIEQEGYEVIIATKFSEAIEVLKRRTVKIAVVDMSLTLGDAEDRQGLRLAKEAAIPVICISGYLTDEEAKKLKDQGISPWFFHKKEFKDKKTEFVRAVADAVTQSHEEIRRKWNILEHRHRNGD